MGEIKINWRCVSGSVAGAVQGTFMALLAMKIEGECRNIFGLK